MKKILLGISLVAFMATATFAHHDKDKTKGKEKCEKSGACCKKGEKASACCKDMEKEAKATTKKDDKKSTAPKKA